MMNSFVFPRLVVAPKGFANLSCNALGIVCCMDNLREKKESFKLSSRKMNGQETVRVSFREQVETMELTRNRTTEKEVRPKKMEFSESTDDGLGIVKFVRGKVFLITGATGFLAKVLIEKIIRTVPDVGKIYLLIKAKDIEAAIGRIKNEIIDTDLFKTLHETYGKSHMTFLLGKLVPVVGNLLEPNLGMDVGIADQIANEVDIIINSAGNTTFDERFDVSLSTNTEGPCRFLSFAKRCKKLMVFLHVSTAYVNGERKGTVMEKPLYLGDSIARERALSECMKSFPPLDVETEVKRALAARANTEDNTVSQRMKEMGLERARAYGWQDTYVFTKAMGEMMLDKEREDIPVVIVRPSVIEGTYRDPIPGWIEGIRMLDPMLVYYAKGELTGFPVDASGVIDVVPADMVVNAILAATVKHATVSKPGLSVYHVASSVANPLQLGDFYSYFFEYFGSSPYMDSKRKPINVEKMKLFNSMDEFHSHIETEAILKSADGKTSSRRLQKTLELTKNLAKIYEPYMFYEGRFDSSNTEKLFHEMSEEERRSFGFDVKSIDWKDYICNIHIPGVMNHVLKGRGL